METMLRSDEKTTLILVANICQQLSSASPKLDNIDDWIKGMLRLGRAPEALAQLENWALIHPTILEFSYGAAVMSKLLGDWEAARAAYERSLNLSPHNHVILFEYGQLERILGNLAKSQLLIGRALDLKPENPSALRVFGSDVTYVYGDSNFQRLNCSAAQLESYSEAEKIHLHFALAKAYEDVGELATAFRHYEIGGSKKRRQQPYSEEDARKAYLTLCSHVTGKRLSETGQMGHQSDVPVFILGMPRSGTSLLEQIISSHSKIHGAGEVTWLKRTLENIQLGDVRLDLGEKDPLFAYEMAANWTQRGQHYVEKLQSISPASAKRIVDKMPGNFNFIGLIHAILPKAKIIHSRRHPVETCLSCYRILFADGHLWSYDFRELGRYYRRYWNLMKHWRSEFPDVLYEVRYEDVVADTEGQARKLIDHLGLEWDQNCLNFYRTDRQVMTASLTQVRKPIYNTSTNRWRKYEKFLKPLIEELGDVVEQYEAELSSKAAKSRSVDQS